MSISLSSRVMLTRRVASGADARRCRCCAGPPPRLRPATLPGTSVSRQPGSETARLVPRRPFRLPRATRMSPTRSARAFPGPPPPAFRAASSASTPQARLTYRPACPHLLDEPLEHVRGFEGEVRIQPATDLAPAGPIQQRLGLVRNGVDSKRPRNRCALIVWNAERSS